MLIFRLEAPGSDHRFDEDAPALFVIADPKDPVTQVSESFSAQLLLKGDIVPVDEVFREQGLKLAPQHSIFPLLRIGRLRMLLPPFPRGFLDSPFRELLDPPFDQYLGRTKLLRLRQIFRLAPHEAEVVCGGRESREQDAQQDDGDDRDGNRDRPF